MGLCAWRSLCGWPPLLQQATHGGGFRCRRHARLALHQRKRNRKEEHGAGMDTRTGRSGPFRTHLSCLPFLLLLLPHLSRWIFRLHQRACRLATLPIYAQNGFAEIPGSRGVSFKPLFIGPSLSSRVDYETYSMSVFIRVKYCCRSYCVLRTVIKPLVLFL